MRFDRRIYLLILTGAGTFTTKKSGGRKSIFSRVLHSDRMIRHKEIKANNRVGGLEENCRRLTPNANDQRAAHQQSDDGLHSCSGCDLFRSNFCTAKSAGWRDTRPGNSTLELGSNQRIRRQTSDGHRLERHSTGSAS